MKTQILLPLWLIWHSVFWGLLGNLAWAADGTVIINEQVRNLPLDYMEEQTSVFRVAINEQSEIIIEGENHDDEPRIVILRFDDGNSYNYNSRLNIERVVIPGAFTIQLPLFGLKTPSGRIFDWQSWQRFIIFIDKPSEQVSAGAITISTAANFSERSFGFDLGTATSPVMTGMTQITESYPGLSGQYLNDRHFPSGNAMTSDGIEGIDSLTLPIPNGTYDVTLWFTMQGQWENLPRQMRQSILVQGQSALSRDWSPN